MNVEDIRVLAEIMRLNELSTLEVTEGDNRIRLERAAAAPSIPVTIPGTSPSIPVQEDQDIVDFNAIKEFKSPMVGVFYASPAPGAQPFITLGSRVKKGDVLCIIEAMKLMNEMTAEEDGEIVDICAHDGDVVEYSQTLFKIF